MPEAQSSFTTSPPAERLNKDYPQGAINATNHLEEVMKQRTETLQKERQEIDDLFIRRKQEGSERLEIWNSYFNRVKPHLIQPNRQLDVTRFKQALEAFSENPDIMYGEVAVSLRDIEKNQLWDNTQITLAKNIAQDYVEKLLYK